MPEIYGVSDDMRCYIQQDLGDRSLFSCLGSDEWRGLAEDSLKALVKLQTVPESEWGRFAGYKPYSRRQVMWDLNYFKYEYLKPARIDFDEDKLEDDMERLAGYLSGPTSGPQGFMMRDFQSRNVMIHDGNRCLVSSEIISNSLAVYKKHGSAVAAIPCVEAVFYSRDGGLSSTTSIPREQLYRTQTPHTYALDKLLWAHEQAAEKGIENTAASCTLMQALGETVYFSKGAEKNMKITTTEDLDLFEVLLHTERTTWLK